MSKVQALTGYDPNNVGLASNNIFGLPFKTSDARLVFIPVPWDVTASNFPGTSSGPENILRHSYQIDLFAPAAVNAWKFGMAMEDIDSDTTRMNAKIRKKAEELMKLLEDGNEAETNDNMLSILETVNTACEELIARIESKSTNYIKNNQLPFLVGGDHSISGGLIRALEKENSFGILQIDAHADLRYAYQGFKHSHASVMRNVLGLSGVVKIVQVGIRELCPEELEIIKGNHNRITTFFDHDISRRIFNGATWNSICNEIVDGLPEKVYITFDVDGLNPSLCPGTGTPVPGGLSYNQAVYLIETLLRSGRQIIGADLVETGQQNIDGMISCRLLFQMASIMIQSNE